MFRVVETEESMRLDVVCMSGSVNAAKSGGVGTVLKSGTKGVGAVQSSCVGAAGVVGRVGAGRVIVEEVGSEVSLWVSEVEVSGEEVGVEIVEVILLLYSLLMQSELLFIVVGVVGERGAVPLPPHVDESVIISR
jgi:hypothetical protein